MNKADALETRKKKGMASWYNPLLLLQTAVRVAISTVFGQFADKREAIAASNVVEPQPLDPTFDYSKEQGELWLDFMADTGDGWNSTYAVARLLTQPVLRPTGSETDLPRGRLLVLGGDQVYPTASRDAYDNRFLYPFETAANPHLGQSKLLEPPQDLYAVPGNHDWYDGLSAFFGLFCRRRLDADSPLSVARPGRVIAGRRTLQTRSYFALRLTHGWWLWGTDSQLEGFIDQPQVDYFRHAAKVWMEPGSKLILCVGQPSWAYADPKKPESNFASFSYLERLATAEINDAGEPLGHQLKLVLTGDSHHYSRFTEDERTYLTCGGGGAFLHPTHHLKDRRFAWRFPRPGQAQAASYTRDFRIARKANGEEALYPDRRTSHRLAFRNLAFPFINKWFTFFLFCSYALFLWVLNFAAHASRQSNLPTVLRQGSFGDALGSYWWLSVASPSALMLIALAAVGYIYFAETDGAWRRFFKGAAHSLLHAAAVTIVSCLVIRWPGFVGQPSFVPLLAAAALSAIVSASLFGGYLALNLLVWGRHWNEAFSSFAYEGYKSILRIQIRPDGALEIHPIGLTNVPRDDAKHTVNPPLAPELIEQPLVIR